MLVRGDWITPHLNFVKYFEKPPLVYWGTAASFAAFGVSELAARVPSLVSGVATVALTVALAARIYVPSTALLTLPIIAIGPLFGMMAQTLVLDMALTWFMTLALAAVWGARYRLAYVATALAILVRVPCRLIAASPAFLALRRLAGHPASARLARHGAGPGDRLPWFPGRLAQSEFVISSSSTSIAHILDRGTRPADLVLRAVIPLALGPWGLMLLLDPAMMRAALAPRTGHADPLPFHLGGGDRDFFSLSTSAAHVRIAGHAASDPGGTLLPPSRRVAASPWPG
jgi:hypothetical protein